MRRPTVNHRLDRWVDPEALFVRLFATEDYAFWLDSGMHADSGMSFMGSAEEWIAASVTAGSVTRHPVGETSRIDLLDYLRARIDMPSRSDEYDDAALITGLPLGWVGWLGYELRAQTMSVADTRQAPHPDAALLRVDRLVAFDHERRTVELIALGGSWTPSLTRWRHAVLSAVARLDDVEKKTAASGAVGTSGTASTSAPSVIWRDSDERYIENIEACQRAIYEGEAYQLCLTTEAHIDVHPDPATTYLAMRRSSPTHSGGFLRVGEVSLLSASPETFLSVDPSGIVESRPIKGTRRRGRTIAEDERLRSELETSDKERAENLMIVDLMRNDLGRVCEVGSVHVPSLLAIETYAHVHQLVSTVRGTLAAGRHPVDAVSACFPAGSMTGAPKLRATQLLDGLERRARGIYSGAFGYFGLDGTIELSMVIRSVVLDPHGATVGAGGGITALSDPAEELAEVGLKAAALLALLGA